MRSVDFMRLKYVSIFPCEVKAQHRDSVANRDMGKIVLAQKPEPSILPESVHTSLRAFKERLQQAHTDHSQQIPVEGVSLAR